MAQASQPDGLPMAVLPESTAPQPN